jgi:hypothetical protein
MKDINVFWKNATIPQKERLIKVMGYHKSFAVVKEVEDLPKRSGGMLYVDLKKLEKRWNK